MRLNPPFESMLLQRNDEPRELTTLFHGTTRTRARRILGEGLLPRSATGVATVQEATGADVWASSERDCVCLYRIQAPFHAIMTALAQGGAPAVLELAISQETRERLLPDIELMAMGMVLAKGDGVGEREFRAARESMRAHGELWPASLSIFDGVARDGPLKERRGEPGRST